MALVVYTGEQSNGFSNTIDKLTNENKSFVGLTNQGATCYLNSLLQTLFMTPEFRQAVFLWRYNETRDGDESGCIPLQLQRLFARLVLGDDRSVNTVDLTKSFGWEGSEVFQQQVLF